MSGNYQPTPPPNSPWSSPAVIGAIVAGALVLGLAVLVGFLLIPSDDDNNADPSTTTTPTQQPSTKTVTMTPSTGASTNTPAPTTTTPTLPNPDVPGTDGQGFLNGPRCNGSADPAVMIGQTSRSNVVVCQVGNQTGRYYYKGVADGNAVEIQYPTRSGNSFTAINNGVTYLVNPSSLTISEDGAVLASEPMAYYWTN